MNMKNTITKIFVCICSVVITWLALSYLFFPIKLSAPADVYFEATMTHMVPLKVFITTVFVLLSLFVYEQYLKKKNKK